jgi:beta-lactamase regulating signal transducer with metallopeptidase domain
VNILLNWIGQGVCVTAAAAALMRLAGPLRPRTKHAVWWATLFLVLALPLRQLAPPAWSASLPSAHVDRLVPVVTVPEADWISNALLLALLFSWTAVFAVRALSSALAIGRAKRAARPWSPSIEATLPCWSSLTTSGRRAPLRLSDSVRTAAVLGVGSPIIAVSPLLLTTLDPDDLDRVVVHEWAHVQRYDDVLNAVQVGVQAIAGWHPAIWWIVRQLRLERELACDDQAIGATGAIKPYAACLAKLASLRLKTRTRGWPVPAIIAASQTRTRITRILALPRVSSSRWSSLSGAVTTCLLAALAIGVSGFDVVTTAAADVAVVLGSRRVANTLIVTPAPSHPLARTFGFASTIDAGHVGSRGARRIDSAATGRPAGSAERDVANDVAIAVAHDAVEHPVPALAPLVDSEPMVQVASLPSVALPATVEYERRIQPALPASASAPWTAAADTGVAIGRGSQRAAMATAGFFNRLGKDLAGSF